MEKGTVVESVKKIFLYILDFLRMILWGIISGILSVADGVRKLFSSGKKKETQSVRKNSDRKTAGRRNAGQSGKVSGSAGTVSGKGGTGTRKGKRVPYFHYLLFPATIVYCEIMLRVFTKTGTAGTVPYLFIFGISAGAVLSAVTLLFSKKINRKISEVFLAVIGACYAAECLVYNAFQFYLSPAALLSGSGDVATGFTGTLIRTIFFGIPKVLVFLIPYLLYVFLGKKFLPARRYHPLLAGVFAVFAIVLGGIGVMAATHGANEEKYTSQFEFSMATKTFGLLTSDRLSVKYAVAGNPAAEKFQAAQKKEAEEKAEEARIAAEEQARTTGSNEMDLDFTALADQETDETYKDLDSYVAGITPTNKNQYSSIFKGKNLILVCAEAFSNYVIDEELTPTLYRMQHKGFYFSEYYQPAWGGSTITGEYSFLMGLIPMDAVDSWLDTKDNNNYFTMGNQLQRAGYWSAAYHNGTYDYYDRQDEVQNRGYARWEGLGNGLEDTTGSDMPSDEDTINAIMDECVDHQPFSVYYMTMDGHAAYNDTSDWRVKKNLSRVTAVVGEAGEKYDQTTINYLCYQLDLEDAMKALLQRLEDAGIADDTVVCLTGDHYPYGLEKSTTWGNSRDYLADLYQLDYEHPWEKHTGAWLLWSGCLENEDKNLACEISEPTYSVDILPTLSNLFGVEYDSRLLVGRDVFSDADPLVIWNNYSWVTDQGKYDSAKDKYYPNEGYTDDEAYLDEINTKVQNSIHYSEEVVSSDYYGHLFGEDTVTEEPDESGGEAVTGSSSESVSTDSTVSSTKDSN